MDTFMVQLLLEDDEEDDFEELADLCLSKYSLKEDDTIDNQIQNISINLANLISQGETDWLKPNLHQEDRTVSTNESHVKKFKNYTRRLGNKRKRLHFGYCSSKEEATAEFIDSDIEDEQIQKFLRSRKKKRIYKKMAKSLPDPRAKIVEMRLFNHFEDKTDKEFFHHLRVTKSTYEHLLQKVKEANIFSENVTGGNFPVQADQALQMFLYYMGHRCTYKFLSQMYHISESAIMSSFLKCVAGINHLDDREVRWPSDPLEFRTIQQEFTEITEIPGIVGSIGGCCVEMRTNKEPPAGYKIGKLRSIMYLLAVTDAHLRFIYIQAGFPGTFCLQEAFESSSLGEMMRTNSSSLFGEGMSYLVGTADLSLHKHVMVPYPETGTLTAAQRALNERLAQANLCEKAFVRLKCRFNSLQTQVYANLEKIPNIVKACCVIHNVALRDSNDLTFLREELSEVTEDYSAFRDDSDFVPAKPTPEAFERRDALAQMLFSQQSGIRV